MTVCSGVVTNSQASKSCCAHVLIMALSFFKREGRRPLPPPPLNITLSSVSIPPPHSKLQISSLPIPFFHRDKCPIKNIHLHCVRCMYCGQLQCREKRTSRRTSRRMCKMHKVQKRQHNQGQTTDRCPRGDLPKASKLYCFNHFATRGIT